MSILHVKQIASKIEYLFAKNIDLSDIPEKDKDREVKILSRVLAAYAIYNSVDCSIEDAASSIVDGSDDNGIDAIYYSPTQKQMIISQSKWIQSGTGEPNSAQVGKFCQGVKDIFNLSFDRFNSKIVLKQTIIEHAISEYDTKYHLILIDTGDKELSKHSQRLMDDLISEMNDVGEGVQKTLVSYTRLNQGKIYSSLANSLGTDPIDLEIGLSQWGKISEPHTAYFGMISASEIVKWWSDYGRRLFEKNIRQVLGTTDVNEEIRGTLKNNPDKFWYFNNGITIVAHNIEKSMVGGNSRDQGAFKLSGVQIVNGAQTVSTIGQYGSKKEIKLDNVWVSARVISLSDTSESFGELVTRANNRQNRIENRDFASQDPEQLRIKTELALESIDYNIVRSNSYKASSESFDLHEATTALACASGKTNLAVQAKREIGKFYEDLSKGIYKQIFNPKISGIYVFNCVKINRKIEELIIKKINLLPKKSGKKYGLFIHGNRIISLIVFNKLDLSKKSNTIDFKLEDENIETTLDEVAQQVFDYLEKNCPDTILGTFFKNNARCKELVDSI